MKVIIILKEDIKMRLWSIHPKYLDRAGLLACWREGLLAQSVLIKGEYSEIITLTDFKGYKVPQIRTKTAYYNHPQLIRFKGEDITILGYYLSIIWHEAKDRGYKFDITKIPQVVSTKQLTVTKGQLEYEWKHLENKLDYRHSQDQFDKNCKYTNYGKNIEAHPLFKVVEGSIESWEKIK